MGLLRKLAGLVVEFPDKQAESHETDEQDVVSQIEQIRQDLEDNSPGIDFETTTDGKPLNIKVSAGEAQAEAKAQTNAGVSIPKQVTLEAVYEQARLPAVTGGFDVAKVSSMLADPDIADLPLDIRARSVKMALKSAGVELRDVLVDAARRDQVLEKYHEFLSGKVEEVSRSVTEANATYEREISEFTVARRALIQQNLDALSEARAALQNYSEMKQREEKRLFEAVAPFVAPGENPVILSDTRPATGRPQDGSSEKKEH